jgi:hypothetical protein
MRLRFTQMVLGAQLTRIRAVILLLQVAVAALGISVVAVAQVVC